MQWGDVRIGGSGCPQTRSGQHHYESERGYGKEWCRMCGDEVMTDPPDIEALAATEHESWSGWTKWMLGQIAKEIEEKYKGQERQLIDVSVYVNRLLDGLSCVKRWRMQMTTPYEELPEKMKESDRIEARKKLEVYRPRPPGILREMTREIDRRVVELELERGKRRGQLGQS